ncbi:MAG: DUF6491 family protein [Rhodospirillaceae bacterium]
MLRIFIAILALAAPAAFAADAAPAAKAPKLQFDQLKGVKSWKKGGDNIVYVQGSSGDWYKAVMLETCMTLDTSKGVNFMTELDPVTNVKESRVVVARHICTVDSLTKVDGPPATATK